MDGTRVADLADLSTDDTRVLRVRAVDADGSGAVASGAAALQSDEQTAATVADAEATGRDDGERSSGAHDGEDAGIDGEDAETDGGDDGIAYPDDHPENGSGDGADDDVREVVLLRLADDDGDPTDDVACWLNYCQHMTHIKLDKGSGAPVRDGEIVCANHGALFDGDSGRCTYGPCEGAYLTEVDVTVADGGVYLDDDEYEYVGDGPLEGDGDLTSSSNVIL